MKLARLTGATADLGVVLVAVRQGGPQVLTIQNATALPPASFELAHRLAAALSSTAGTSRQSTRNDAGSATLAIFRQT
ncbi:hypothetical protein V1282_003995 [Nitrobacteraceae bacterium AZCC 2146]